MKISVKILMIVLAILLALPLMVACSSDGDDGDTPPPTSPTSPPSPTTNVTITIGELIDLTGVASTAMAVIRQALKDVVEYYNEENLIPGVTLKIVTYDEQYDPAKDIPGYEWLKEQGADFIWTPVTSAVDTLQPTLNRDQFVLFAATANLPPEELAGGYVFSLGITPENEALTMMKWIAENDWDWETNGPAKVGGAAWSEPYSNAWFDAAERYCNAHPDQLEWAGGRLTSLGSFIWNAEIDALKDVDYCYVPVPPQIFAREYRMAGGKAKFLMTDPHAAFLGPITRGNYWDEIDGSLLIRSSRWYNENGLIIDLTNKLLDEKHSADEAASMRQEGCGYISVKQAFLMLDIVRYAVETYGTENFNAQTLYDAATTWSFSLDGIDDFNNFNQTKRISQDYYRIYEARAAEKELFVVQDEWLPQVTSP